MQLPCTCQGLATQPSDNKSTVYPVSVSHLGFFLKLHKQVLISCDGLSNIIYNFFSEWNSLYNFSCKMVIFLQQGSREIKNRFKPEELVFTVDDVICSAVGQAIEKYEKAVSFLIKIIKAPLTTNKDYIFSSAKT